MAEQVKIETILESKQFPGSNQYDPQWILANQMGLNPLWLTEWLHEKMPSYPGMHMLDLGCGEALSSIFLAHGWWVALALGTVRACERYQRGCATGCLEVLTAMEKSPGRDGG